jgi:hypothetical protein
MTKKPGAKPLDHLAEIGGRLIDVAYEYWREAQKVGVGGAVVWLQDGDGKMVLFTRGEYRSTLLSNIERLGPARMFGASDVDGEV